MEKTNFKHRVISVNEKKKNFVYRVQAPMWLKYYPVFDGFYLSVPNEVASAINAEIKKIINPNYSLGIPNAEYNSVSFGVKLYERTEAAKAHMINGKLRIVDIAIKFGEYKFGKKVGLSKTVMEYKAGHYAQTMLGADDYFDEVDVDGVDVHQPAPELPTENQHDLPF